MSITAPLLTNYETTGNAIEMRAAFRHPSRIVVNRQNQKQTSCFLNEQGVTITSTRLITPGHTFELARLNSVRIKRDNRLFALLLGKKRSFRLMVSDAPNKAPFVVFETQDAQFVKRLEIAMKQAADAAKRERVV